MGYGGGGGLRLTEVGGKRRFFSLLHSDVKEIGWRNERNINFPISINLIHSRMSKLKCVSIKFYTPWRSALHL